jgi:hypothetical protein
MPKSVATFLALLVTIAAAHAQCPQTYVALHPTGIPAKLSNSDLAGLARAAVADFDGDGKPDLAYDRAIYVDFKTRVDLPLRTTTVAEWILRAADVNRDGRPDLLVGSVPDLVVLLNNGDKTFTRKTTHYTNDSSDFYSAFIWADFNGDGRLDVFVGGSRIYLANGDGTYTEEISNSFTKDAEWIASDVNGDHRADLIAAPRASYIPRLLYERSAIGFAPPRAVLPATTDTIYYGRVAADFDGDGADDVLFTDNNRPTLIYANLRELSPRPAITLPSGGYLSGDFNGDGAPDLLGVVGGVWGIYLNDGRGGLQFARTLSGVAAIDAIVDTDGDGKTDLIVDDGVDIFVLRSNGDGTFNVPRVPLAASDSGVSGDFDGDGDDDIALPGTIAWNNGDNTFRIAPLPDPRMARPVRAADLDGDGKAEVITLTGSAIFILSPRPDGTLVQVASLQAGAVDVAVGDFTGTHKPEIAAILGVESRLGIGVYEIRDGASPRFFVGYTAPMESIAAADLNGDGADDIIVGGGTLQVLNAGDLPFTRDGFLSVFLSTHTSFEGYRPTAFASYFHTNYYPAVHEIVAGDFDADGKTDLAVSTLHSGAEAAVLYGDGAGAFPRSQRLIFAAQERNFALRAADLNGDGIIDLSVSGAWRIYSGGPGGLTERGRYFAPATFDVFRDDVTFVPLLVRPDRKSVPWIIAPVQSGSDAFVYRPACPRPRVAHH